MENARLIFKTRSREETIKNTLQMTIVDFEAQIGRIEEIKMIVMLQITVFYRGNKKDYTISSENQLIDLRKILAQDCVPIESQILHIIENK
jgi:hypothetical protein